MATYAEWVEGARLRTLPAAVSPVVAGAGAAALAGASLVDGWWRALLALALALALQVGVNYANDYSDGVRGTDATRVGPLRLVGSGAATAGAVRNAALTALAVGALCGLALAVATSWWLLVVGATSIAAAWFYTGGRSPYGYRGLGEIAVFVFFGLVAVLGTTYVLLGRLTWVALVVAVAVGSLACAILVANNVRDIASDAQTGKRTLTVVLGDSHSRVLYQVLVGLAFLVSVVLGVFVTPWALLALGAAPLALRAMRSVRAGVNGPALIPVLRDTGLTELLYAVLLAVGLALG